MPSLDMATFEKISLKLGEIMQELNEESDAIVSRIKDLDILIESRSNRLMKDAPKFSHQFNFLQCQVLLWRKERLVAKEQQLKAGAKAVLEAQGLLVAGELQPTIEVLDDALARMCLKRLANSKVWGYTLIPVFSSEEHELIDLILALRDADTPAEAVV